MKSFEIGFSCFIFYETQADNDQKLWNNKVFFCGTRISRGICEKLVPRKFWTIQLL